MDSWPAWVRWLLVLPVSAIIPGLYFVLLPAGLSSNRALSVALTILAGACFVWCGIATAPRFKLLVALILGLAAVTLAHTAYPGFGLSLVVGVVVACGLTVSGYLRRRQVVPRLIAMRQRTAWVGALGQR
jgi:hypothetical protein